MATNAELEQEIVRLNAAIADRDQTIAEFGELADRAIILENTVFDQQQLLISLQATLAQLKTPEAYTELAIGWMNSTLGKRANDNPKIDLTGFHLGVDRNSFPLIQTAYKNILTTLAMDGQPVTTAEQQEIGSLLHRLGFT